MTRIRYVVRKGRVVEKTWDDEQGALAVRETVEPFASRALPKKWPYANQYDKVGRPVFHGKREIEECVAKARHHGEPVIWDFDDGT